MAPCNWEINTSCCPGWDDYEQWLKDDATAYATQVLWALTGRRFGSCPRVVRPCGRPVGQTYRTYGVWTDGYNNGAVAPLWVPYIDAGGAWRNCGCGAVCACKPASEVWLPGPIPPGGIMEVRVDGIVVPPAEYRLDLDANTGKFWLVAQQGRVWPECQDFNAPSGAGVFQVTYARGEPLPDGSATAMGQLACEYAKFCLNKPCALSGAVTTISRDGVTYEVLSPSDLIKEGLTPIPSVNQWIYSVNPRRLPEGPRVWSPDEDYPRVTV